MNSDRVWELVFLVGKVFIYGLAVYMACVWACVPLWVRSIVRHLEALNKSQSETNRLLTALLHPADARNRESEATRNPFQ